MWAADGVWNSVLWVYLLADGGEGQIRGEFVVGREWEWADKGFKALDFLAVVVGIEAKKGWLIIVIGEFYWKLVGGKIEVGVLVKK